MLGSNRQCTFIFIIFIVYIILIIFIFRCQNDDYEYLRNIAEILRNQKIRINDQAPFSSPIFKVNIDENDKAKNFAFITREGAEKYIEFNSTILNHLPSIDKDTEYNEDVDRRKSYLFDIENNTNLEIEKIIEIIKRNY